jgi:hypothetical protein
VGEFASEVEVLAVGLRQCVPQSLYFFSVLLLQVCDLAGQSENEGAFGVDGGGWCGNGSSLGSQAFDAFAQVGVVIEEGVRDACLQVVRYFNETDQDQPDTTDTSDTPNIFGWHLDRNVLGFLTTVGAELDVDEYDMAPEGRARL